MLSFLYVSKLSDSLNFVERKPRLSLCCSDFMSVTFEESPLLLLSSGWGVGGYMVIG